ncbi:MAG: hypothetical protein NVS4B6_12490 [Mycobacterium sp.]
MLRPASHNHKTIWLIAMWSSAEVAHTDLRVDGRSDVVLFGCEALRAVETQDLTVDVTVGKQKDRGVGELIRRA